MTIEGLARRDRMVIGGTLDRSIPVAVVLAGGYAANVTDTVCIQAGTAKVAKEELGSRGWVSPS